MSIVSPQWLYELHQDQIYNILSQYDGPVGRVMLEEWIIEVSRTLCVNRDSRFRAEFQKILRRGARVVLHGQITNYRSSVTQCHRADAAALHDNPRQFRERLSEPFNTRPIVPAMHSGAGIQRPIKPNRVSIAPSTELSARWQESSSSVGGSSDAPPPYTPTVPIPTGDRFASLPPFPDPESNIVFAPGTFDDFTPEEVVRHYRPAITRMVFEAMGY